jgi:hypothetical protein
MDAIPNSIFLELLPFHLITYDYRSGRTNSLFDQSNFIAPNLIILFPFLGVSLLSFLSCEDNVRTSSLQRQLEQRVDVLLKEGNEGQVACCIDNVCERKYRLLHCAVERKAMCSGQMTRID